MLDIKFDQSCYWVYTFVAFNNRRVSFAIKIDSTLVNRYREEISSNQPAIKVLRSTFTIDRVERQLREVHRPPQPVASYSDLYYLNAA